jgi:hypothetical protein
MATVRLATGDYGLRSTAAKLWAVDRDLCFKAAAAVLVLGGFFLPWVQGAGVFSLRTFSGFELAGIAGDLGRENTGVPLPSLVFYLVPATVLNAAVLVALAGSIRLSTLHQAVVSGVAGLYGCAVAGGILFLVLVPGSGVHNVAGGPQAGLFVVFAGSLTSLVTGLRRLLNRAPTASN